MHIPPMPDFLSLQRSIPASLLFIQPTHQHIHVMMELFIRMIFRALTIGALALMDQFWRHCSLAFSLD
jgi:hypothetical protein